jgi:hypothetical protein
MKMLGEEEDLGIRALRDYGSHVCDVCQEGAEASGWEGA